MRRASVAQRSSLLFCLLASTGCAYAIEPVLPGVEVLVRDHAQGHSESLSGKRVGIVTNPTGLDRNFRHTIDLVRELPGVEVVRLFAPEHGIRGGVPAGEKIGDSRDAVSGLPIVSLYGASRRPPPELIRDLDVVLYDIQDIGCRSYTYISTLTYVMEACEAAGTEVWVLDRPEPMGGRIVSGAMLEPELISFIGIHPVPLVYGMTPGEWARMIRAERTPNVKLRVIPLAGWKRGMTYGDLDWAWTPPSPHIPRWESCYFYAMTGTIGELGRVSEGVGTPLPFEQIGAPWIDGVSFADAFNALGLGGVRARATSFRPRYGTYSGEPCSGIQIHLEDTALVDPPRVGMALMKRLNEFAPEREIFVEKKGGQGIGNSPSLFMKALGDRALGATLAAGGDPTEHAARIDAQLEAFRERRAQYLLYD